MASFFDSGPLPEWKQIQQWLGKDIPWKLVDTWDRQEDSGWINDYVKKLMKQTKIHANDQGNAPIRYETKQEAKYVTVSLRMAPDIDVKKVQLFATEDRLKLAGLPGDKKRAIRLPCLVYPRSGKTTTKKDGTLLVRFKRKPTEKTEIELFIQP